MKITKNYTAIIGIIAFTILAGLLLVVKEQDERNKDKLAQLHASELSVCWEKVAEEGGSCRIEYIKDRTDTIIGAKVVKED